MGFIDFHAHMTATAAARDQFLATMESLNIERAVVVAGGVVSPTQLSQQIAHGGRLRAEAPNRTLLDVCAGAGGKLMPFYFANPYSSTREYRTEGKSYYGLKLAPAVHGITLNDARNAKFVRVARKLGHPVYLHCLSRRGFDVEALLRLAEGFPDLIFVMGHGGRHHCDFAAVDQIETAKNIYFETSGVFSSVTSYAVTNLGIERILFGSEHPLQHPSIELEKARLLGFDPAVLNGNALRVLGLKECRRG